MRPLPEITLRAVAELAPYARNARTHSDEQVRQLAASIQEFGWTNPLLVDEAGGVIAGHGRLRAAQLLGHAEVPVIVLAGLSATQRQALVLADNKLALNAAWDSKLLAAELAALKDAGYGLDLTGFAEGELASIFAGSRKGKTDPDAVPEPPVNPVSAIGDVWLLGKHRLVCGDCTDAAYVAKALGGVLPRLMVTDPPYGVDYDPAWRSGSLAPTAISAQFKGGRVRAVGKVNNDARVDWTPAWRLFPGDVAYVWHGGTHCAEVQVSLEAAGFAMRAQIVWAKQHFAISRGDYHWQHEPCWYAVRKSAKGHWGGDRKQSTLWQIDGLTPIGRKERDRSAATPNAKTPHSTQKPVECMRRPIENNSSPGQAVYEPFSGSGTTIIAAEMTGRAACALELNPAYVDVAVQRWEAFTGEAARLEGDGRTFAAISDARDGAKDSLDSYHDAIASRRADKETAAVPEGAAAA